MVYVYDLETYKNFFSGVYLSKDGSDIRRFMVHDSRNDFIEHLDFLKNEVTGLVGYNSINFDYPILHNIIRTTSYRDMDASRVAAEIYKLAQNIIEQSYSAIPPWHILIPQLDLFKLWHFDNFAKSTSLKDLQIAMKWHKIQDLPYKHNEFINDEMANEVLLYNENDTRSTHRFYELSKPQIDLRRDLSTRYSLPLRNANDPKIGQEIFAKLISEESGIPKKVLRNMRTHRTSIPLKDCLVNYIDYKSDEFNDLYENIKSRSVVKTKGELDYHVIYKGFKYDFGTGGIHGATEPGTYVSSDRIKIMSSDVASYYPNLSIKNGFYPEHLGEVFCRVYEDVYNTRKHAKRNGIAAVNQGLKLALNGTFGKSGDENSFFYDLKFLLSITLNGQLLLTMLAERLQDAGFKPLMINTDGFEFEVPVNKIDEYIAICSEWEETTELELEHNEYKKVVLRDVNNYTAIDYDGEIKQKGVFEVDKAYHKDHSFRIVPLTLREYFFNGTPIDETLRNHDDILDFCGRVKSKSGYQTQLYNLVNDKININNLQKTNRVYISKSGGSLYKTKGDRVSRVYSGAKVTVYNDVDNCDHSDNLDYSWYSKECNKILNIVEPKQLSIFN